MFIFQKTTGPFVAVLKSCWRLVVFVVVSLFLCFSSHVMILEVGWTIYSLPELSFLSGDHLVRVNFTLSARISPQWLSELWQL